MILPHEKGSLPVRLKFKKVFDLDKPQIPLIQKSELIGLPILENTVKITLPPAEHGPSSESATPVMSRINEERKAI